MSLRRGWLTFCDAKNVSLTRINNPAALCSRYPVPLHIDPILGLCSTRLEYSLQTHAILLADKAVLRTFVINLSPTR